MSMIHASHTRGRLRSGAVLMELVISIAIFVGAGMFTLSVVNTSYERLEAAQLERFAVDLAKSKLAELEAGLISIGDLQDETIERVGSLDLIDLYERGGLDPLEHEWGVRITTTPGEFRGLTLVEVAVFEPQSDGYEDEDAEVILRQLVRLRDERIDEYEQDELLAE